jgi:O-antigen/teichoic acid export membrane protein
VQFLLKGFVFRLLFMAISFLVSLLIAKLAGVGRFGSLSLMIVNAAVIQIITGLGTDAAIVWHGASGKIADRDKVFSFTVYSALIQLFLFAAAAYLFFIYGEKTILSNQHSLRIFYAELFYFAGLILTEKYSSLFYSQQQAALSNKLLAMAASVLFGLLLVCWLRSPGIIADDPEWILSFFVCLPAFTLIFFYQVKWKPSLRRINRSDVKSFINFSLIVLVTNLIQFIAFRADFWFINYYHGKEDTGIYAQAAKFSQLLWIVPGVLAGLIVPALKNEKNKMSNADIVSICRLLFFSHIVLALLLIAGAFLLYRYFLPDDYFEGLPALLIMIPGYILFTITTVLAAFFSAGRLLRINLAGSCLCCLIMLITDILLIPRLSYNGAAIANLISYSATTAYFIIASFKYIRIDAADYFSLKKSDWNKIRDFNFKD